MDYISDIGVSADVSAPFSEFSLSLACGLTAVLQMPHLG